jgi:hypothetical protein
MEKVKLPIRIKIASVLLLITVPIFMFLISMNSAGGYTPPKFFIIPFILIFSYFSFAVLLLRRIKWAWYGAIIIIGLWILYCLYGVTDLLIGNVSDFWEAILGNLVVVSVIIIPNAILLVLLFPKLKKYKNTKNILIGLCIIIGLSILFNTAYLDVRERNIGVALFFMSITVLPSLILLKLLFSDRKKYLEVASLDISPKRKKGNILIIVVLLAVLGSGIISILSIEEDPCRGRGCQASTIGILDGIRAQAEIFYDNNGYRYSSANLTSPFSGACPEFGDGDTMFAKDRIIADAIETAKKTGNGNANCYMSADARSYAIAVEFRNDACGWCIDSAGYAKETTINPATGLCSE